MSKHTQCERLKNYLAEFESVTPLEALRDLGIMRLGARIWDLEQDGYAGRIQHDTVPVPNRWNKICHVTRYTLLRDGQQCLPI